MSKKREKGKRKQAARAYEAAQATPTRRHVIGANLSQDAAADAALARVRDWGRYFDENHDLAGGVLDDLVKNVIGSGIVTIPKPLNPDGSIDERFGAALMVEWRRWMRRADVSGELTWNDAQRLIGRAWFRDGDCFQQHVQGRQRSYPFGPEEVPYRIELLESDMVPWDLSEDGWRQGIRHDTWRRPVAYAVHLEHPGEYGTFGGTMVGRADYKIVPAEQMSHLKLAKRWPATRGISVLANVITRLFDIKDLEESERVKDRILASWAAVVTRTPDFAGHDDTDDRGRRFLDVMGGTVVDSLAVGESITGVGADYPVANMPEHIADQLRRVSAGTGTRYSSIARRYDGSYSAQRQEMVESEGAYRIREDQFVSHVCRVVYERFVATAVLDGRLAPPRNFDLERAAHAEYRGPMTPWIDPLKEAQADALAVDRGFQTLEQIQIKRGASPEIIGQSPPQAPVQLELIEAEEAA